MYFDTNFELFSLLKLNEIAYELQEENVVESRNYKFHLDKREKNGKRFINPDGCTFYLSPVGPAEIDKIIDDLNLIITIVTVFNLIISVVSGMLLF